jgi:hypothetical protein
MEAKIDLLHAAECSAGHGELTKFCLHPQHRQLCAFPGLKLGFSNKTTAPQMISDLKF